MLFAPPSDAAEDALNWIIVSITFGTLGLLLLSMAIGKAQEWWRTQRVTSLQRRMDAASVRVQKPDALPGSERTNEPAEPDAGAGSFAFGTRTGALVLNRDEVVAVARMIEHKTTAEHPTKASIVWAGFAVKKGDSVKYKRASEVYDMLFILPPHGPEYQPLDADRRPAALGNGKGS